MNRSRGDVVVLGAGLAGLAAGHALARAGRGVTVLEKAPGVGGLARTVVQGPFRFDLGGHRFFTQDPSVGRLVEDLLGPECLEVGRRSQILLRGRYIDYPLSPLNALSGLGPRTTLRIVLDHLLERLTRRTDARQAVSLEEWVVGRFGRTLFDIYFKEYSEKVWGIGCDRISADWVAQRIQGLSLGAAVKNAFFGRGEDTPRSLTDRFRYPSLGIGRLAERLREEIERENEVVCGVDVRRIRHRGSRVEEVEVRRGERSETVAGEAFVSTIPLPHLVRMLEPRPPGKVLGAAARLGFRDLVVVAVMLGRERATDQSWIYFPERGIPFGRIHEPTNWSARMAPPGTTLLVAERFCFRGDATWNASDPEIAEGTLRHLEALRLVRRREVLDTAVLRVPRAYPLFEVGYREHLQVVLGYLGGFDNLFPAGRGGTFSYHNMDHAMASGMDAAERIVAGVGAGRGEGEAEDHPARRTA